MSGSAVHLLGIVGSAAAGGRTREVVERLLAATAARGRATDVAVLDLATDPVEWCDGRPPDAYGPGTTAALRAVESADGFVVGTPVYRASFTGVLKNLFDLLPDAALAGKPCALAATGGGDRHFLAVDGQLRYLLAAVGAPCAARIVYAHGQHFRDSRLVDERLLADVEATADELARLLGSATAAAP